MAHSGGTPMRAASSTRLEQETGGGNLGRELHDAAALRYSITLSVRGLPDYFSCEPRGDRLAFAAPEIGRRATRRGSRRLAGGVRLRSLEPGDKQHVPAPDDRAPSTPTRHSRRLLR